MRRAATTVMLISAMWAAQAKAGTPAWTITPDGVGPLKVGMTVEEASRAIGAPLDLKDGLGDSPEECSELAIPGHDGVVALFQDARLNSVSVEIADIRTEAGVGVGSTEQQILAAYPDIVVEPADYDDPPAHNLTYWSTPDVAGIRFKTDVNGMVGVVDAGGDSITYMEGCA